MQPFFLEIINVDQRNLIKTFFDSMASFLVAHHNVQLLTVATQILPILVKGFAAHRVKVRKRYVL